MTGGSRAPEFEFGQATHKGPKLVLLLGGQRRTLQLWVHLGRQESQQQVQVEDAQSIGDYVEACSSALKRSVDSCYREAWLWKGALGWQRGPARADC